MTLCDRKAESVIVGLCTLMADDIFSLYKQEFIGLLKIRKLYKHTIPLQIIISKERGLPGHHPDMNIVR